MDSDRATVMASAYRHALSATPSRFARPPRAGGCPGWVCGCAEALAIAAVCCHPPKDQTHQMGSPGKVAMGLGTTSATAVITTRRLVSEPGGVTSPDKVRSPRAQSYETNDVEQQDGSHSSHRGEEARRPLYRNRDRYRGARGTRRTSSWEDPQRRRTIREYSAGRLMRGSRRSIIGSLDR